MTKITVDIPESIIDHIATRWIDLAGVNIMLPKRKLVLWALEKFAQSSVYRNSEGITGAATGASPISDERVVNITIDVPDQLFNRIVEMWELFVESTIVELPKRKLVLWALDRFVRFCDTAR